MCVTDTIFFEEASKRAYFSDNVSCWDNRRRGFNLLFFSNYAAHTVTTRVFSFRVRALRFWPLCLRERCLVIPLSALSPGICQGLCLDRKSSGVKNFNVSWVLRQYFKMSLSERDFCQSAVLFSFFFPKVEPEWLKDSRTVTGLV